MNIIKFKSFVSFVLIFALLFSNMVFAQKDTTNNIDSFTDVPKDHWGYKEIHLLRSLGITDGIGNNCFGLGKTVTRVEFVSFLVKLMQWQLVSPEEGSFSDNMDPSQWYYKTIETAMVNDVISKDADEFRPMDPITREEMAVMLIRALGYKTLAEQLNYLDNPFDDVTDNIGYITMAKDFGIITGVGGNLFKPQDTAKREEAAAMMIRMYEKINRPIQELHGFYAIKSFGQAAMIKEFDSIGFGWCRLEYDKEIGQVVLNTSRKRNNEYAIPEGFEKPLYLAKETEAKTSLMIYASNDTLINTEKENNVPFIEYILTNDDVADKVIKSIASEISTPMGLSEDLVMDGVIIDFENMRGEVLKEAFNEFLKKLKEELDKNHKSLYVAVHPVRKGGQAYYDGYDYKTIGEIADKIIIMAHDYYAKKLTDEEMDMGYTLTPPSPIDDVYYALKAATDENTGVEDRSKIWIQFSFDAVQWKLKDGKVINKYPYKPDYESLQRRLAMEGVDIHYSQKIQNPYALFFDINDETENIIWYEDSRSIQAKINVAKMFGVTGVSLWRLGNIPDFEENNDKKLYLDVWDNILKNMEQAQ